MNRLAHESSPYLRQHADNPVDWYPWSREAFEVATQLDKPILLSIGYSACHWCHVMAHESFENPVTASVMNEFFVNIKVDREERPDVDAVYMEAVQAISGQGGWPMTVFLMPDGKPFFAGTYFPIESQAGRPGFVDLLRAVHESWVEQRDEVATQAEQLRQAIEARTTASASTDDWRSSATSIVENAFEELAHNHDKEWGGFGRAPKFPQTMALELLLRRGRAQQLDIVVNSLDSMASGGMYDHVGGGFSRYSVDAFWMVPHFEKMLYDQAQMARVYLHAYEVTHEERFAQVTREIVEYVLRDLRSPAGGFYSAEDADSEGEEGRFYVWRPEQIDEAVNDPQLAQATKDWYGVTAAGNFEGANILHRPKRGDLLRNDDIESARTMLFEARSKRIRPGLDDKVLTEWNAMFIATLAEASRSLRRPAWLEAAETAADFLVENCRNDDGRWMRSWHEQSGARHLAFANDYAWLIEAFVSLSEATGKAKWRKLATEVATDLHRLFYDDAEGGFFTTGHDGESLIVRSKDLFDGATPSANSIAATALMRVFALTGDTKFREWAESCIALVADPMKNHPTAFTHLLHAVDTIARGATEVVIAGDHPELMEAIWEAYLPLVTMLWGERDDTAAWDGKTDGGYICRNETCSAPVTEAASLLAQLGT